MPGPATLFSTIGAVGAAASAVAYVTKAQVFPDVQHTSSKIHDNVVKAPSYASFSSNKKMRIGHRNDIHVLMFVVGKD
ncbi:unnamed protein product [Mucor fragilis]